MRLSHRLSQVVIGPIGASAILAAGCARQPAAHKLIEVPTGGEPVLTTAERQHPPAIFKVQSGSGGVARASFDQAVGQPQPLKALDQWTGQDAAADALGRIGAAAVPALADALQSSDPDTRLKAVEVLGRMGPNAQAAVPELTRLLDDPDERIRKAAARTIGQIGPAAQQAVPALVRTLLEPSQPALTAVPHP
jgi:hypothetical protein